MDYEIGALFGYIIAGEERILRLAEVDNFGICTLREIGHGKFYMYLHQKDFRRWIAKKDLRPIEQGD